MKTAWALAAHCETFAEALRRAWKIIKLGAELNRGVVSFSYLKKDGSTRKAKGTLMNASIKGTGRGVNYRVFTYYDLDANGWRCACVENLLLSI